ncbi:glycosyltransferase family 2 protein [Flagellimonas pacifica]|uniref:Glycosyltransferase involved in cell wall bisynthesis n=1 Tax=Flagellimonas pacifica TaxID=1247520 RepID=A0A285MSX6_9FLAO|nr:glycosyltransferase family 2 protein [Allomuricauda parva]SNZ00285.1 Glycosyltransferase involved in cell wall bisynthesis [Allomuricauda parva]
MQKLTGLLITYNEEDNIKRCLDSLAFADEIIVVDSFSTDATTEIIKEYYPQVKLFQRPFKNFTDQKSYALAQSSNDWVFFIDADEEITPSLQEELKNVLASKEIKTNGFWIYRQFFFMEEKLRFSGWQTDKNLRFFRKSKSKFTAWRIVHETVEVDGHVGRLEKKLNHFAYDDYKDYKNRMIKYGRMRAQQEWPKEKKSYPFGQILRPIWKFFNHYILRFGILDGKKGIVICYLNALGVHARYRELNRLHKKQY